MTSRILEIVEQELSGPNVDARVLAGLMARIRERVEALVLEPGPLDVLLDSLCCLSARAAIVAEDWGKWIDKEPLAQKLWVSHAVLGKTAIRLAEAMDETLDEKG